MTLINGDRIVTAQLYDDEHEEFIEKEISIIDYLNAYTDEGVTTADDVLDKIKTEIIQMPTISFNANDIYKVDVIAIINKYMSESDHKCHTCKHYISGERDGSCGSYICKNYSDWESEE